MNRIFDRSAIWTLAVGALLAASCSAQGGATPPHSTVPRSAPPAAAVTAEAEAALFTVQRTGPKAGTALIFIPGLASPAEVWEGIVGGYADSHDVHVLQLAGFAGVPAVQRTPFLETVTDELAAYIRHHGLRSPVVVGHSLGGFLALQLAIRHPDLPGALVVVDGLPFLAAAQVPGATAESVREQAEMMRRMMAAQTPEQLRQNQQMLMPMMMVDRELALRLAERTAQSDPWAVAQGMYELMTVDLRDELASIRVPVRVVGSWVAYGAREQVEANFVRQFERLPAAEIVLSEAGRHFLMYDDPALVAAAIDGAARDARAASR
jgi:N-formylmaleamate deformylase